MFMKKLAKFKGAATKRLSEEEYERNREKAFRELAGEFGVKLD